MLPGAADELVGLSREALQVLVAHRWPGNVRELENAIERALVMSVSSCIQLEDLAVRRSRDVFAPRQIVEPVPEWS